MGPDLEASDSCVTLTNAGKRQVSGQMTAADHRSLRVVEPLKCLVPEEVPPAFHGMRRSPPHPGLVVAAGLELQFECDIPRVCQRLSQTGGRQGNPIFLTGTNPNLNHA